MSRTTDTDHHRTLAADLKLGQRIVSRQEAAGPVDHWAPTGVPEYMQTQEYAAAAITATAVYTDEEAAQVVADRMIRVSILRTVTGHRRRILVTRAGIEREILPPAAMSRQWAQLTDLSHLSHVEVRVVPAHIPIHPAGFQILHGVSRVLMQGPMGTYTPPGAPAKIMAAYQTQFAGLWKAAHPYPG